MDALLGCTKRGRWFTWVLALFVLTLAQAAASAQATATATRSLGFSAFGGYSDYQSDDGSSRDKGFLVGVAVNRHFHLLDVGIEPRFTRVTGPVINYTSGLGNVKFEKAFGPRSRLHAFVIGGIGYGKVRYGAASYTSGFTDDSTVYDFGGGLDYDLTSKFSVRGEYVMSFWDPGVETNGLTPNGFDGAVVYRFHPPSFFHRRR